MQTKGLYVRVEIRKMYLNTVALVLFGLAVLFFFYQKVCVVRCRNHKLLTSFSQEKTGQY